MANNTTCPACELNAPKYGEVSEEEYLKWIEHKHERTLSQTSSASMGSDGILVSYACRCSRCDWYYEFSEQFLVDFVDLARKEQGSCG